MADDCIVCLSALEVITDSHPTTHPPPRPRSDGEGEAISVLRDRFGLDHHGRRSLIARLQPCGHVLHNECLRPWVQRANTCPLCRQSFNTVGLSETVDGPLVSSYSVESRVQAPVVEGWSPVASSDTEPPELESAAVCQICNGGEMGGELVGCRLCRLQYHFQCARLSRRPPSWWICRDCCSRRQQQFERPRSHGLLARGELRRTNVPAPPYDPARARPRQTEVESESESEGPPAERPDSDLMLATLRRFLGGRFDRHLPEAEMTVTEHRHSSTTTTTTADTNFRETWQGPGQLDDIHRQPGHPRHFRPTTVAVSTDPPPRSRDEQRAWEDLDRARRVVDGVVSKRRKRKAPDQSPAEPTSPDEPARKFKRPMTRRGQELEAASAEMRTPAVVAAHDTEDRGQSFLRSLLDEVQASSSSGADGVVVDTGSDGPEPPPRPSFPLVACPVIRGRRTAPAAAAAAAPRAARSGSPLPLTSAIEPFFPTPPLSWSSMPSSPISYRPPHRPRHVENRDR